MVSKIIFELPRCSQRDRNKILNYEDASDTNHSQMEILKHLEKKSKEKRKLSKTGNYTKTYSPHETKNKRKKFKNTTKKNTSKKNTTEKYIVK